MERVRTSFLKSRVARRVLLLFVACALLPIAALATVMLTTGSARLEEESRRHLRLACKMRGLWAFERLQLLDSELQLAAQDLRYGQPVRLPDAAAKHFLGLALMHANAAPEHLLGEGVTRVTLTGSERAHLARSKPLIRIRHDREAGARILIGRALDPLQPDGPTIWCEVDSTVLFDPESLTETRRLCVLDRAHNLIATTTPEWQSVRDALGRTDAQGRRNFHWNEGDTPLVGAAWQIFLASEFGVPGWTIVLSEEMETLNAPIAGFESAAVLISVLALAIVTLLSILQIRRTLGPIEVLQAATSSIMQRKFDTRVEVSSGDEFEELADSFNSMADRLGRQFGALSTLSDVQRSILSSLEGPGLVEKILPRLPELIACDGCAIAILQPNSPLATVQFLGSDGSRSITRGRFGRRDTEVMARASGSVHVEVSGELPRIFQPLREDGARRILLLPIRYDSDLAAVVALAFAPDAIPDADDVASVLQMAEQMVVGLRHSTLVRELGRITWGTLSALARAIDASSPWTMGHSERVMELAVDIARDLGLARESLRALRRGALLHDIGKIGIRSAILEKAGALTDEEYEAMQSHVTLGVRILEPITAFADAIPVVREHHERMDGSGYPAGSVGEAISLNARIVAVADCFDALRSDRPYRKGMSDIDVLELIRSESPEKFDPDVVASLERIMLRGGIPAPAHASIEEAQEPPAVAWKIT